VDTLLIVDRITDRTSLPTGVRTVAVTIIMLGTATVDHIMRGSITTGSSSPIIATTAIMARTANTSLIVARLLATASHRITDRTNLLTGPRPKARVMTTIASPATRRATIALSTVRADRPLRDDRPVQIPDGLPTSNGS
jgi:hypothetical protein